MTRRTSTIGLAAVLGLATGLFAQQTTAPQPPAPVGYDDTPMQPNGKWRIHDANRPQPAVVTPGGDEGPTTPPPSDATVLVGRGSDLGAWQMGNGAEPTWKMADGVLSTGT